MTEAVKQAALAVARLASIGRGIKLEQHEAEEIARAVIRSIAFMTDEMKAAGIAEFESFDSKAQRPVELVECIYGAAIVAALGENVETEF